MLCFMASAYFSMLDNATPKTISLLCYDLSGYAIMTLRASLVKEVS